MNNIFFKTKEKIINIGKNRKVVLKVYYLSKSEYGFRIITEKPNFSDTVELKLVYGGSSFIKKKDLETIVLSNPSSDEVRKEIMNLVKIVQKKLPKKDIY